MSKVLNKYVTALNYADNALLVLSRESTGVCFCSFATAIGTPAGRSSASISPVFLVSKEIFKKFLKIMREKRNKHGQIVLLAISLVKLFNW